MGEAWEIVRVPQWYKRTAGVVHSLTQWRSRRTGLRCLISDVDGPLCKGYFVLATESLSDDGCPHTLEHLVFLGSERYPYKGVLDELANRNLSQGTNAWTDNDHTAYTLTTAGEEAFLNMLPVYLDHILYPRLTEEGFRTEVHHITAEGNDAGVVYCEMQARQNTASSLCHLALLRDAYRGTGYASQTGGFLDDLRALKVETVREYHKRYYRPDNLCLIVSGKVNPANLLNLLDEFDQYVASKGPLSPIERPWSTSVPPLVDSVERFIEFPSEHEEYGTVTMGWRGPEWSDFETKIALRILWRYLTSTSVSPLQQAFIERDDPLCAWISPALIENSITVHYCTFDDAKTETLDDIGPTFFFTMKYICESEERFNISRMRRLISKTIRESISTLETYPHEHVCNVGIEWFLYGRLDDPYHICSMMSEKYRLRALLDKTARFWIDLATRYLIDAPCVTVIGSPSAELAASMANEERQRVALQAETLGPERLAKLKLEIEEAEAVNSVPTPHEILKGFKIPDVESVPALRIATLNNTTLDNNAGNNVEFGIPRHRIDSLDVFLQLDSVDSEIVSLRAIVDTSGLPPHLRLYLELFVDVMFDSPMVRDGTLISHDEVILGLQGSTVHYFARLGLSGSMFMADEFAEALSVELYFLLSEYESAVGWMRDLLFNLRFDPARLLVSAKRLLSSAGSMKRRVYQVMIAAVKHSIFTKQSNHRQTHFLAQEAFLKQVISKLEIDPQAVVDDMTEMRSLLVRRSCLWFYAAADFSSEDDGTKIGPWRNLIASAAPIEDDLSSKSRVFPFSENYLAPAMQESVINDAVVIAIGGVESSCLVQTARGPTDYCHEDTPAILVAIEFLVALEGPFWKRLRGLGLTYSYSITRSVESGLIQFKLARSADIVSAAQEASNIVHKYALGQLEITNIFIQAAKSSVCYSIVSQADTVTSAIEQSVLSFFRRTPPYVEHRQNLLHGVSSVNRDDVMRVLREYIVPLFEPATSRLVVVTGPSLADEVCNGMKTRLGRQSCEVMDLDSFFSEDTTNT